MTRLGFVINLDTCSDNRGCMVGCKAKTQSFLGSHNINVMTSLSEDFPKPQSYYIPVLCRHCERPSCAAACPKGVLEKRPDGIVAVGDTSLCETCDEKPCLTACPYSVIDLDPENGRISKCDMCADLVSVGIPPACMRSCLSRSIMFGDFDDPDSAVSQMKAQADQTGILHYLDAGDNGESSVYYILSRNPWRNMQGLFDPAWENEDA